MDQHDRHEPQLRRMNRLARVTFLRRIEVLRLEKRVPPLRNTLQLQDRHDPSVNLLVEVDHLTKGHFVVADSEPSSSAGPSRRQSTYNLTAEEQKKVEDGELPLLSSASRRS